MKLVIRTKAAKLGKVAFASVMDSLDKAAKLVGIESLPFSPDKLKALGEQWEKERMEVGSASDTLRGFLEEAIENLLPESVEDEPTPRVIVFIDDLDRCLPDMAYRLLEGSKCRDPADCMPIRSLRYFLAKRILTEVFAELNPEEPKT
jgi:hypothetical protein